LVINSGWRPPCTSTSSGIRVARAYSARCRAACPKRASSTCTHAFLTACWWHQLMPGSRVLSLQSEAAVTQHQMAATSATSSSSHGCLTQCKFMLLLSTRRASWAQPEFTLSLFHQHTTSACGACASRKPGRAGTHPSETDPSNPTRRPCSSQQLMIFLRLCGQLALRL
jgi:hypothetical protein